MAAKKPTGLPAPESATLRIDRPRDWEPPADLLAALADLLLDAARRQQQKGEHAAQDAGREDRATRCTREMTAALPGPRRPGRAACFTTTATVNL
jgi:hypothetical protein